MEFMRIRVDVLKLTWGKQFQYNNLPDRARNAPGRKFRK